jgi:hypothetical protein
MSNLHPRNGSLSKTLRIANPNATARAAGGGEFATSGLADICERGGFDPPISQDESP